MKHPVSMSPENITRLRYHIANGGQIKKFAVSIGMSNWYVQTQMNKLGIKKPNKDKGNKKVTMTISIVQKHYSHALKRFERIIQDEYGVQHEVKK